MTVSAVSGPVRYAVRHTTTYDYAEPVPVCHNEIHLVPRSLPHQTVLETSITIDPTPTELFTHRDFFGNVAGFFSIEEGHERLVVSAHSRVEVTAPRPPSDLAATPWESIRDRLALGRDPAAAAARPFVFPSPLVRPPPVLCEYATRSFTPGRPWSDAVIDLTHRIHRDFAYDPAATTTGTPVAEVFAIRRGVCQDFAHLQIACLRSIGLAARYVSGYLSNERSPPQEPGQRGTDAGMVGADASHAWLACWGGDDVWLDVDPTNDCLCGLLHVTVAWGRDYADVCPVKGVCVGGGRHTMNVAVTVSRRD